MKKVLALVLLAVVIASGIAFIYIKNQRTHDAAADYGTILAVLINDSPGLLQDPKKIEGIKTQKEETDKLFDAKSYKKASDGYKKGIESVLGFLETDASSFLDELNSYGTDTKNLGQLGKEAKQLSDKNDYLGSFEKYKELVSNYKKIKAELNKQALTAKPALENQVASEKTLIQYKLNKDYKVNDILILGDGKWAVVKVVPLTIATDEAKVALKKSGSDWVLQAGPGTYFLQEDFPELPSYVIEKLNAF